MKRFARIPALVAMLALAACSKVENSTCSTVTTAAPATEIAQLRDYLASNGISAEADTRGFYYTIKRPGSTAKPDVCSKVQVNYTGRLTNGSQFDGASQVSFSLSQLIAGWQEGIPLIGEGGSITLYLPPSLAYGSQAQKNIPANSILIFDIELLQFN